MASKPLPETADGGDTVDNNSKGENKENAPKPQLVSLSQLLQFADTPLIRLYLVVGLCSAVVTGCAMPFMAYYFASAFEDLGASTDNENFMDTIRELSYTFMVLGVIICVSMATQGTLCEAAAALMTRNLQATWFRALLRQDVAFFDLQSDVAGQATLLSSNGNKYRKGVGRKLGQFLQFLVTVLGAFAYALWASWKTSLVVLAIAPLMAVSVHFVVKMNTSQTARANAAYAKAGSIVATAVSAIRTVLACDAVLQTIVLYEEATQEAFEGAARDVWLLGLANGSNLGAFLLSYMAVTLFGSWVLYDQVIDTGCDPSGTIDLNDRCDPAGQDVFGALMGITIGASVLPQVAVTIESFVSARAACYPAIQVMERRVDEGSTKATTGEIDGKKDLEDSNGKDDDTEDPKDIGKTPPLPPYVIDSSSTAGRKLDKVEGRISFENVTFSYPARPTAKVFESFTLDLDVGKTVALVGPSGTGKSTAVQLVTRFYDPTSGSVRLDGVDLRDLNVKWLRQQIGLVSQEPKLFALSIAENIASGKPGATQEEIEQAARMANAHDFIVSFPDGYNTQVGDLGAQLSGGQKQRVALARVLIRNPKVLLLDEATSALDSESEAVVQEALDNLMSLHSMTTLVIAHRLSTVRNADAIAVMKEGKVVEIGKHDELLDKRGAYFDLVQAQTLKQDSGVSNSEHDSSMYGSQHSGGLDGSSHSEKSDKIVIRFRDVRFHYPSRPDNEVFRGLNLSVRHGETLALVGGSGSGKSTVISLLECFYRPTQGSIEYHGVDLKDVNTRWLRASQLGLVSQEPVLFDMTVEENIRFGTEATMEEIEVAARQANCHNFIMEFPDGYQTRVGQGSSLVSGGQKQRIAIARALLRSPNVLLLDEATSALDSQSEKIVQETLDGLMIQSDRTCIVIAHRLSTLRNADRIAVVERGKVREMGTHEELMAKPEGKYRKLQEMQSLGAGPTVVKGVKASAMGEREPVKKSLQEQDEKEKGVVDDEPEVGKKEAAQNAARARLLAKGDGKYLLIGAVGAVFAAVMFPAWGFIFAYMIEVLYTPVLPCPHPNETLSILFETTFTDCDDYLEDVKDDMQEKSFKIGYAYIGIIVSTIFGFMLLFHGFGVASERMNKRVRDSAFAALLRQEVSWFDLRSPGAITSRLSDDAALIHSFVGEPIRTLMVNLSSVLVGVVVSFIYMWPFALLCLGIIPFMGIGAELEIKMYYGEDEGDDEEMDESSPGGIVIETLSNIRTVASMTLEDQRATDYEKALFDQEPNPIRNNLLKGSAAGIGQLLQFFSFSLMFFWGGWLLSEHPSDFTYRDYLISMFALFFSMYGLTIATEGAVNREKAKAAAARIFTLIDRESEIDPLSETGRKEVQPLEGQQDMLVSAVSM